jgi:hypothetical protein
LIILFNSFCPVHTLSESDTTINLALTVLRDSATVDVQARRYLEILEAFATTLDEDRKAKQQSQSTPMAPQRDIFNVLFGAGDGMEIGPEYDLTAGAGGMDFAPGLIPEGEAQPWPTNTGTGRSPEDYIIDFDSFWWTAPPPTSAGAGAETHEGSTAMAASYSQVPLYGLMKPS